MGEAQLTSEQLRFDSNLIPTLAQTYRSSVVAIKELVTNSWDSDAGSVEITLPSALEEDASIIISDDGEGMSRYEVRHLLLNIGYNRRLTRGDKTGKERVVRGQKGIGKFAGLQIAHEMEVNTVKDKKQTSVVFDRDTLLEDDTSLANYKVPTRTVDTDEPNGTKIILRKLNQSLGYPSRESLTRALIREFGIRDDFTIAIDGEPVTFRDTTALEEPFALTMPSGTVAVGTLWIAEKPSDVETPGIAVLVNQRQVGRRSLFGADDSSEVPKSILRRMFGEVRADHLQDFVRIDWEGLIENSLAYQELAEALRKHIISTAIKIRDRESAGKPEAFVRKFDDQIRKFPIPRRDRIRNELFRLFDRFWDDSEERKAEIAQFVINAFERDEYWLLVQRISEASRTTLAELVGVLEEWALFEVSGVVDRARYRLKILDALENLTWDASALELQHLHQMLARHTWLLGEQYELHASNQTLRRMSKELFGQEYKGSRPLSRPDILLAESNERRLIVELKRTNHIVKRHDVQQAQAYRDEVQEYAPERSIVDLIVIGGRVGAEIRNDPDYNKYVTTFNEILLGARRRLNWLVDHLSDEIEQWTDQAS